MLADLFPQANNLNGLGSCGTIEKQPQDFAVFGIGMKARSRALLLLLSGVGKKPGFSDLDRDDTLQMPGYLGYSHH